MKDKKNNCNDKFLKEETNLDIEKKLPCGDEGIDEFFLKVLSFAIKQGTISISTIQRNFNVGYARAGRIIDKMEIMGFITSFDGEKVRQVLITKEEYEKRFGPLKD